MSSTNWQMTMNLSIVFIFCIKNDTCYHSRVNLYTSCYFWLIWPIIISSCSCFQDITNIFDQRATVSYQCGTFSTKISSYSTGRWLLKISCQIVTEAQLAKRSVFNELHRRWDFIFFDLLFLAHLIVLVCCFFQKFLFHIIFSLLFFFYIYNNYSSAKNNSPVSGERLVKSNKRLNWQFFWRDCYSLMLRIGNQKNVPIRMYKKPLFTSSYKRHHSNYIKM